MVRHMEKKAPPFTWVDWLLLLAIAGLSIQLLVILLDPAFEAWKNRPRAGSQVKQQFLMEQGSVADAVKIPINYLLYLPEEYAWARKWPLVVFLHGAGDRGDDLEHLRCVTTEIVSQCRRFSCILLSPQCPADSCWSPELVVRLIEHVSNLMSVDQDRVYLTGYSMGGSGTWETASYAPERFAAIAPVSGGGNVEQAERLKTIPIWAFHGDQDKVVPIEASQRMVDAVRKCGGQVNFTIYPGAGHGISERTYQNKQFYAWLLGQRRSPLAQMPSGGGKRANPPRTSAEQETFRHCSSTAGRRIAADEESH